MHPPHVNQSHCVAGFADLTEFETLVRLAQLVHFVLSVTVVLVNAYTMAAIWPRRRRRSTQSSLFVLQLAFADMLYGVSMITITIFSVNCTLVHMASQYEIVCLLPAIFSTFTWTLSASTLALIAVDRYVCIVHSLRYYEFMKTRRVLLTLASSWIFSVVCATLYLPTWDWAKGYYCQEQFLVPPWHQFGVQLPLVALVLFVVAVTHTVIRIEVKRNDARWRAAGNSAPWPHKSSSASIRSARITVLIVVSFVMCYVPMQVFQILVYLDKETITHFFILQIFTSLWYLLNPFIYAWKNASIREDMTVLWWKIVNKLRCHSDINRLDVRRQPPRTIFN